jgi:putative PIN family toxin of toxin-antitoxin system
VTEIVVFDTNVRVSALFWRGTGYRCWLAARAGLVEVVYCPEMVAEFTRKLYEKFDYSVDDIQAAVYDLRRFGRKVEISGKLRVVPDDPDDDMFVECALVSGATMIVSSDNHLLKMDGYQEIRVVTPDKFLAWLTLDE